MPIANRIGRPGKAMLLLAVGAAGGGAALAVASVPDSTGVVHACYGITVQGTQTVPATTPSSLRIIDPSANQTCNTTAMPGGGPPSEATLNWNTIGVQGPPGNNGATGPRGATGPTQTIVSGHTLTISGGSVVTVGDSPGVTILPPTIRSTAPAVARVDLSFGRGVAPLSFNILAASLIGKGSGGVTGGGGGTGKIAFNDIQITKVVDKASPKLSLYCASGKHISRAQVVFRKAGSGGKPQKFLVYTLQSVLISSYQIGSGGSSKQAPQESLTLNFGKITISAQ